MKRFFILTLFAAILGVGVASADDRAITTDALPSAAKEFLATTFPQQKVSMATIDKGVFDDEYKVLLNDGTQIEFDRNGNWESIKHKSGSIPTTIVPQPIVEFVGQRFEGAKITKIERDNGTYEVDLMGGVDLKFDRKFNCIEVDM